MQSSLSFDNWEKYPLNLPTAFPEHDLVFCHRRLQHDSKRLFSQNVTDICLETALFDDGQGTAARKLMRDSVTNDQDIEELLLRHLSVRGDHYIFIRQAHTWAPLQLSEATFRKIFTAVKVNPAFLDLVHTFGNPQGGYQSSGSGGYDVYFENSRTGRMHHEITFDFFYNLRYTARTGRESWPWSERVMGVYHRYDGMTESSTWIIIQPTAAACKLPTISSASITHSPAMLHCSLFRSTAQSWKAYLKHLEGEVWNDNRLARLDASIEAPEKGPDFCLAFSNVQRLQHRCELIRDAISVLRSNVETLKGLKSLERKTVRTLNGPENQGLSVLTFEVCLSLFSMNQKWANDIMDSANQTGNLITTLLNMKNSHALASNTASLNLLAEASKKDADAMLTFTKATREDSRTVKLVTVLAFAYLPGTFVATVFSTGFITASLTDHGPGVARQSVIQGCAYALAAATLTIFTLLISYVWDRRTRLQEEIRTSGLRCGATPSLLIKGTAPAP